MSVTSRGVIFTTEGTQKKFLLIHRIKNGKEYYTFPWGHVEDGESPEEALIREIQEEINIDINVRELLKKYENADLWRWEYFYLCEWTGGACTHGSWPERDRNSPDNFYEIVKIPVSELVDYNVLPPEIKELVLLQLTQ